MDTNALMMPVELDVRVFDALERALETELSELDLVVPAAVLTELEEIAERSMGEEGIAASVGGDLARERCRLVETAAEYADDALVELAEEGDVEYVLTNDAALRERVLGRGVRVIGLRGADQLAVTTP
ncbi:MAG: PIN domain-containing protein [Haloferacaceae archaeon]